MLTKPLHIDAEMSYLPVSLQSKSTFSRHATKIVAFFCQEQPEVLLSGTTQSIQRSSPKPFLKKHTCQKIFPQVHALIQEKTPKENSGTKKEDVSEEQDTQKSPLLAKCITFIMKKGHKAKAATCMNLVLKILLDLAPQKKEVVHVLDIIRVAINNVKPAFELRKARFGGRTQFIPSTLPLHKQENQALRVLVQMARLKHKKVSYTNKHHEMYTFAYFLAQEINDAYTYEGAACQAKHNIHKQAEQSRTNARRRWW